MESDQRAPHIKQNQFAAVSWTSSEEALDGSLNVLIAFLFGGTSCYHAVIIFSMTDRTWY